MYIFTLLYKMRYIHELFDFSFLQVKTRKELSGVKMWPIRNATALYETTVKASNFVRGH